MSEQPLTLRLHAMPFFGRIGHADAEREVGTHIEVDVELELRLSAGPVHELKGTVDYRAVHAALRAVVEEGEHPLLEGLAVELLDALEAFDWRAALVRVRKPNPPFPGRIGHAEVEVRRER